MDIKSQIAPKGLEFKPAEFVVSDKYACILTAVSYPKYINPGFLSNLTSMSGIKMVIKHIPLPFDVISKMINKEIADLKVRYQEENDLTIQEKIRQDYESLEQFIKQLAASQAKIYDFQLHVMITADSEDELTSKKLQVKSYLEAMDMKAIPLRFEQEKVLKSMLPIFKKQDIEDRIGTPIPAPTIAAMYPFIFDSIKDPGLSTLLGVDFSGGVVLFNQFLYQMQKEHNRNNANMIILGTSGSGKSTAAKVMIRTHIRNNNQIVIIDPEGEFEDMTRLYGGDYIELGKGGEFGMINPLEVIVDADEEELKQGMGYAVLTRTLQTIKAFMKYYDPSITEDVLNVFSEMVQETYRRFGIDFDTDFTKFSSSDYPTFKDVYATVRGKITAMPDQNKERDILEQLELKLRPIIKELRYYFDGVTTIRPKSNFIVFNIRELMNADTNIRNALFFNTLKFSWSLTLNPNVNTVMMVDEAHVLLSGKNTLGADFLAQVQRRARKYNTGTIIITQQPTDFSDPGVITQGKAIFDNAAYYLVMGLRKQAVEDLGKLIDLNDNERENIKGFNQGEALFVCGSKRMTINVVVTEQELDSFGSGGGL
ncbi:MAG: ATP-binding protein [Bacilli bacterium]|nr:ATP-binding protein [Bacilli bacterium]